MPFITTGPSSSKHTPGTRPSTDRRVRVGREHLTRAGDVEDARCDVYVVTDEVGALHQRRAAVDTDANEEREIDLVLEPVLKVEARRHRARAVGKPQKQAVAQLLHDTRAGRQGGGDHARAWVLSTSSA